VIAAAALAELPSTKKVNVDDVDDIRWMDCTPLQQTTLSDNHRVVTHHTLVAAVHKSHQSLSQTKGQKKSQKSPVV
jgi:hypothetical protein